MLVIGVTDGCVLIVAVEGITVDVRSVNGSGAGGWLYLING